MVGTVSAALVMTPILTLLLKAYGFQGHASATANALAAPQANLMASVAKGVFAGGLPWGFVAAGMAVAAGLAALDTWLERKRSGFRTPVLAVAIGFYLPWELSVPIFAGGLIHQAATRWRRRSARADREDPPRPAPGGRGLLFASGLITGEALVGILLAVPVVLTGKTDVLAVLARPFGAWPGALLLGGVALWLWRVAARPEPAKK